MLANTQCPYAENLLYKYSVCYDVHSYIHSIKTAI